MINRFKNALYNVVGGFDPLPPPRPGEDRLDNRLQPKFPYSRPYFLHLSSEDEIQVTGDHQIRPIIVPRDISKLPWNSGYAEAVNAGKSQRNEDQATFQIGYLSRRNSQNASISCHGDINSNPENCIPYYYYAVFDGHAGYGAAIVASNQLHHVLHEKLVDIVDDLLPSSGTDEINNFPTKKNSFFFIPAKTVSQESLVSGALEAAFWEMDKIIERERSTYRITGGCTVLVALFILGKLYVANAGDSRSVICRRKEALPMSHDFTPESERQRVRQLAALKPELLGDEFTHLDFIRRPIGSDIGKRILYREAYMTGWGYKVVSPEDLKFPVVYGEGKRSRVMATIGVTRGFGDHDLRAQGSKLPIKPFLSCQPEVLILNVEKEMITDDDVLVLGTDGLWDVTPNEKAAELIQKTLSQFPIDDEKKFRYRYTSAAQDLVMYARGKLKEKGWKNSDDNSATIDDITVFIIPIKPYKDQFLSWKNSQKQDSVYCYPEISSAEIGMNSVKMEIDNAIDNDCDERGSGEPGATGLDTTQRLKCPVINSS